jgi:hypothetical protein
MYNFVDDGKPNSTSVRGKINYVTMSMYRSVYNNLKRWEAKQHISAWEEKLFNMRMYCSMYNNVKRCEAIQCLTRVKRWEAIQCLMRGNISY